MWTAHLFQVASGDIGPRVEMESMTWTMELNGTESISLKLKKSSLPSTNTAFWLAPWWAGVVVFYNGVPIVAGPILSRPNETYESVSVNCGGIRSVLSKRVLTGEYSNWDQLAKSVIQYSGLSLGTIAQRVVKKVQQKPSGALPITFPIPEETSTQGASHERTYRGFNLQNINANDILNKLSNVIEGPDVMFKPKLVRDNELTFEMWHGTEDQPRIYQSQTPVWDTTPARSQVVDMSIIVTGSYQTSRVYSLGAGTDEGLLIKVATNEAPLQMQFPLLETVINVGNSENPTVVANYGISNLWANKEPLMEIQMTVRADGSIPLGSFWPGDMVEVVTEGWLAIPDGVHRMRLLAITGDTSNSVKVSLQKEDKFS